MTMDLYTIRRDYIKQKLSIDSCNTNPFNQLSIWIDDAIKYKIEDPTSMSLATVNIDNRPSSRIVLLKSISEDGLIFFTNYNSRKAKDLDINNYVSSNFFWASLERQIRIEGKVFKLSDEESNEYFSKRPYLSKIGAWASRQSEILDKKLTLENKVKYFCDKFKLNVPKPDFWGGYKILPNYFEFWQGRPNRLHDRISYKLNEASNKWIIARLYP